MYVSNETIHICGVAVTAYPREKSLNANWKIIKLIDATCFQPKNHYRVLFFRLEWVLGNMFQPLDDYISSKLIGKKLIPWALCRNINLIRQIHPSKLSKIESIYIFRCFSLVVYVVVNNTRIFLSMVKPSGYFQNRK